MHLISLSFVLLMYAKYWFTTPLASAAARQDLDFMSTVLKYRLVNHQVSWSVLKSCYRHMGYLTPQLVVLSLADTELEDSTKELMAQKLHQQSRQGVRSGKPAFPMLPFGPSVARQDMASLITPDSWLVFDLLQLGGPQDWLLSPLPSWDLSPEFKIFRDFSYQIVVVNYLAEQGIHLATDFVNSVQSKEQRASLFQVVKDFRGRVKDTKKSNLNLC